jgi:predicted metal-dependent HD superfamily phosphohydrolase
VASAARLRFSDLWRRLGGSGDGGRAFDDLAAAHSQPGRAYHTIDHVLDCLARLDESGAALGDHDPVEAAIWFHDVVYDPHRTDNEEQSAAWAVRVLGSGGISGPVAERIGELIRLTAHTRPTSDPQGALLCDIDLSILGRDAQEFDEYEQRIRREYEWVPEPLYRIGRTRVLSALQQRDRIYRTDYFHERYEERARANLHRSLARLRL